MPIGRRGSARAVVMAVIEEEFDALAAALEVTEAPDFDGTWIPAPPNGVAHEIAAPGKPAYPFVLARSKNRSNIPANETARDLLEKWRPEFFVLVGVAGGIARPTDGGGWKGPMPGDIVVGEHVHYADFTKIVPKGQYLRYFQLDPPTSELATTHGDGLRHNGDSEGPSWHDTIAVDRPPDTGPHPAVHIGEIIAVEALAGDPNHEDLRTYLERFDHASAIDMESAGVGRAIHGQRASIQYNPRWMVVRAISDRVYASSDDHPAPDVDNNAERATWKDYAAASAAACTRALLHRLLSVPRGAGEADPGCASYAAFAP